MADRTVSTVTRTVTISDLTPAEMASIFAAWTADEQAAFFHALHVEAASWPPPYGSVGWQLQFMSVADKLTDEGRQIVATLADAVSA